MSAAAGMSATAKTGAIAATGANTDIIVIALPPHARLGYAIKEH